MKSKAPFISSMPCRLLGMVLSSCVTCQPLRAVESPLVIPFQGQMTTQPTASAPGGDPIASGQYSIIFNLYDVAVGGQPIWTERHTKVGVSQGMVNVFLGSITSMAQVQFDQTRYLGITIDVDDKPTTPDPEMVPRQMIIPAFHAKNAENASKLAGFSWSNILAGGSNNPETGFLSGAKLQVNSVTGAQIADGSVTSAKIQDATIANADLADNAVTSAKIANGQVTSADIADSGVVTADLGDIAVTNPKIADGAVSLPKLAVRTIVVGGTAAVGNMASSGSSGDFTVATTSFVDATAMSVTLTTSGRPVVILLASDGTSNAAAIGAARTDASDRALDGYFRVLRGASEISQCRLSNRDGSYNAAGYFGDFAVRVPPGAIMVVDAPAAGTHTYKIQVRCQTTGCAASVSYCKLLAFEL